MLKTEILKRFYQHPGEFLSGEGLSQQIGCTRAAVWKAIEELRKEGYQIEAYPNRGYRLVGSPDRLSPHELVARLRTSWMGKDIVYHEQLDSTQTLAHQLARDGAPEGTVVLTEQQTQGRGRMGRSWHSPKSTGIWVSFILRPEVPPQVLPQLTLVSSVCLVEAIQQTALEHNYPLPQEKVRIKWPNDIYIGGKKAAGILTEVSAELDRINYAVVGIGLNVNHTEQDFPKEIQQRATSLRIQSQTSWNRVQLLLSLLERFESLYQLFIQEGFAPIKPRWEQAALSPGTTVTVHVQGQLQEGRYLGINEDGSMIWQPVGGEIQTLYSGDVNL